MEIKMTTTDHVTDHVTDHACEVSLIEQLKSVPLNSRKWIKDEKGSGLTNIPYGRYCQEAAGALQKAKAEVERLREQLQQAVDIAEEFWNNQKQAITVYHEELADELDQLKATMNHDKK